MCSRFSYLIRARGGPGGKHPFSLPPGGFTPLSTRESGFLASVNYLAKTMKNRFQIYKRLPERGSLFICHFVNRAITAFISSHFFSMSSTSFSWVRARSRFWCGRLVAK